MKEEGPLPRLIGQAVSKEERSRGGGGRGVVAKPLHITD